MRKDKIWSIDNVLLQETLNNSASYVEICEKLGLENTRSQIKMIRYRIKVDKLELTQFTENRKDYKNRNGVGRYSGYDLNDILVSGSTYHNATNLKVRLYKAGLLENKCSICGISEWNGKEIVCQLDHINGVNNDNRLENLRILCPNCHSQTDTFTNKNNKVKEKKHLVKCSRCGEESYGKVLCDNCQLVTSKMRRKVERPPIETLLTDIENLGYAGTGRKYGVSDNSIRKWIKK